MDNISFGKYKIYPKKKKERRAFKKQIKSDFKLAQNAGEISDDSFLKVENSPDFTKPIPLYFSIERKKNKESTTHNLLTEINNLLYEDKIVSNLKKAFHNFHFYSNNKKKIEEKRKCLNAVMEIDKAKKRQWDKELEVMVFDALKDELKTEKNK